MINIAIAEAQYQEFLTGLLDGDRIRCARVVQGLLAAGIGLKDLYIALFQRALYEVGERWERGLISVTVEHAATAIVERLLTFAQSRLFGGEERARAALIACVADEYHQLGARMVADIFELHGWRGYFLGANTPLFDLLQSIGKRQPEVVGLSLSVYFNLPALLRAHSAVRREYPEQTLLVGGQAFRWGYPDALSADPRVARLLSLDELERFLETYDAQ
jgi:MerR family transcriptional regulator, light-induced transcriptional regulator